jgi:CheY-like chemotaxis protein
MSTPSARQTVREILTIARRIRIVYALGLLPLILLTVVFAEDTLHDIRGVERALTGARTVEALRVLQDDMQRRRFDPRRPVSAAAVATALDRIEIELGADPDMAGPIATARASLAGPLPDAPRQTVRELIATLVERYKLLQRPRTECRHLVDALFVKLPDLVDHVGRAAQLALNASSIGTEAARIALNHERLTIARLIGAIDGGLAAALTANSHHQVHRIVALGPFDTLLAGAAARGVTRTELNDQLDRAFDILTQLREDGGTALAALMKHRVDDGWRALYRHAAITVLLLGISALFLFLVVEGGMLNPLRGLGAVVRQRWAADAGGPGQAQPCNRHGFTLYRPDARSATGMVIRAEDFGIRGRESVLVIDHDGDLLEPLAVGLEALGYAVIGAETEADAVAAIAADPELWGVVVLDPAMAGRAGLALLETIKSIPAACPVIVCTSFLHDVGLARVSGADGVFVKPVEPAAVARRIRALLGPSRVACQG